MALLMPIAASAGMADKAKKATACVLDKASEVLKFGYMSSLGLSALSCMTVSYRMITKDYSRYFSSPMEILISRIKPGYIIPLTGMIALSWLTKKAADFIKPAPENKDNK